MGFADEDRRISRLVKCLTERKASAQGNLSSKADMTDSTPGIANSKTK